MCGIAGIVAHRGSESQAGNLRRMAASIAHRGPDDEGFLETTAENGKWSVGLAHRRLSIIDLSGGHQPLGNEDGQVQIVYNGEVYNYRDLTAVLARHGHKFSTHSDTETIVHAYEQYGSDCVQLLRGMFAFAIWDARHERLFLARDRFGQKPLFLYESDGLLLFASEIKALLTHPDVHAEIDLGAISDYLAYRYVPGPATLFKNIRKLQPGHWAVWEKGELRQQRYYTPPDLSPHDPQPLTGNRINRFAAELENAVSMRMVSDVPFGGFLSGGIDSSVVIALMCRHSSLPVKTFSVGFAEARYSELSYARQVADYLHTDHHELVVSEQHLMQHLVDLVQFRDAPVSEPSDIPIYLLSREARKTVKMVLTGEGSDEVLGGYPKHVYERFGGAYRCFPASMRRHLLEPLIEALPYRYRRAKTAIRNLGLSRVSERMPGWFGALSPAQLSALYPDAQMAEMAPHLPPANGNSALRGILAFDQMSWLPDNLLERGDRMTMAASLEARMPFMDHGLAAWISTLPDHARVRGIQTKWILRQAAGQLLPEEILRRPKVGFRVPVNEWFQTTMRDYIRDHLLSSSSRTRDYYERAVLEGLITAHLQGRQNHEKLLWTLLNLEIWHRCYVSS